MSNMIKAPIVTADEFDKVGDVLDVNVHSIASVLYGLVPFSHPAVIDAGCGTGKIYASITPRNFPASIELIDTNKHCLQEAAHNCRRLMPSSVITTHLRDLTDPDLKMNGSLLLFTNTTGFFDLDTCLEVMSKLHTKWVIANFFLLADNIIIRNGLREVHPLSNLEMLKGVQNNTFTWDLDYIAHEGCITNGEDNQSSLFSLQALAESVQEWREKLQSDFSILEEVVYRDFKTERMVLLRRKGS